MDDGGSSSNVSDLALSLEQGDLGIAPGVSVNPDGTTTLDDDAGTTTGTVIGWLPYVVIGAALFWFLSR